MLFFILPSWISFHVKYFCVIIGLTVFWEYSLRNQYGYTVCKNQYGISIPILIFYKGFQSRKFILRCSFILTYTYLYHRGYFVYTFLQIALYGTSMVRQRGNLSIKIRTCTWVLWRCSATRSAAGPTSWYCARRTTSRWSQRVCPHPFFICYFAPPLSPPFRLIKQLLLEW